MSNLRFFVLSVIVAVSCIISVATSAHANDNIISASAPYAEKDSAIASTHRTLGMVTGSRTGTYYRFGQDIKNAVKQSGLDIDVKESSGSIDNINRIGSRENAAFGIVQSDVLGFLMRSDQPESQKLVEDLRLVFPFYSEEVHTLAHKSISDFSELNGKIVVVGPKGSGSWLTSMNLFSLMNIQPSKMLRLSPEEGMVAVLSGKADAMIYVAGKPVKLFNNLDSLASNSTYADMLGNVHLLPLNDERMLKEYASAIITPNDYDFVSQNTPTLSVTSVLVSYGFSDSNTPYAKSRCDDIKQFSTAMNDKVAYLQKNGHPKWQEVNLEAEVGFWKRDKCSMSGTTAAVLEDELLSTLREAR